MTVDVPLEQTALMLVDLQNDFIHPQGAYARGGALSAHAAALPERLAPVCDAIRAAGGWIVSTHFTLVPGRDGVPFVSPHLLALRPFLRAGDFAPGSVGQALVDRLAPADLSVEKVAYSAFYMTRLEWVLQRAGIRSLIFAGIVTNGGVASTLRDAHVRDYQISVLEDGCAAADPLVHRTAIESFKGLAEITSCAAVIDGLTAG